MGGGSRFRGCRRGGALIAENARGLETLAAEQSEVLSEASLTRYAGVGHFVSDQWLLMSSPAAVSLLALRASASGSGDQAAVEGAMARGAYVGIRSEQVRGVYDRVAAGLRREDTAARTALKAATRLNTPAEIRAVIEAQRPSLGPPPGSGGTANRTNAGTTRAARILGTVGRASAVGTVVLAADDIATSDNPVRATASNAGAIAGAVAFGQAGAELGLLGGPVAPFTSPVGGLIGAVFGGFWGYQAGGSAYDSVTRSPLTGHPGRRG